jgi:hypothetical protein
MTLRSNTPFMLLLCLSACSWLVNPEDAPIKCEVEKGGMDYCPTGTSCIDNRCKPSDCEPREVCEDNVDNDCDSKVDEQNEVDDICNEVDDDCDGNVDEREGEASRYEFCDEKDNDCDGNIDEDSDPDKDTFTECATKANRVDCEPMQASAHPGGDETCDGLDNDCDGNTDNPQPGKSLCPANQLCSGGRCLGKTCAVPQSGVTCAANERCVEDKCQPINCAAPCTEGQFCNGTICVDVPRQRKNGESCTLDADCVENSICIDSAALHLPAVPRRVCGKACCSDTDCGTGESCFASGTGARSCLPRTLAANTNPGGARSCMHATECSSGQVCAPGESTQTPGTRKLATTMCRQPNGPLLTERPYLDQCAGSQFCSSRLCLELVFSNMCTATCRTTSECSRLNMYSSLIRGICQYVDLGEYLSSATANYAPICVAEYDTARPAPATCQNNMDCPERTCIGASTTTRGKCAPTCCNDLQCKTARPNSRCEPVPRGTGRYEMRCIE